jgi:hypothetical protein
VCIKAYGRVYIGKNNTVHGKKGTTIGDLSDGDGGDVRIDATGDPNDPNDDGEVENKGDLIGGDGEKGRATEQDGERPTQPGKGGKVVVKGKKVTNSGKEQGGKGGDGDTGQDGGKGGGVENEGEVTTGKQGKTGGAGGAKGSRSRKDGKSGDVKLNGVAQTVCLPGAVYEGENVTIQAGPGGVITMLELPEDSIVAVREVFIIAGDGEGLIDLTGIRAGVNVIRAGVCIHVLGEVLLDPDVSLADITEPDAIVSGSPCFPRGACCLSDGTCSEEFLDECDADGGEFRGEGSTCDLSSCNDAPARGDTDCSGDVNFDDIDPFVLALTSREAYEESFPNCDWLSADIDGNGDVNFDDIDPFVECLTHGGCD